MTTGQIRIKILLLQLTDLVMISSVIGLGVYGILKTEYGIAMAIPALIGLMFAHKIGNAHIVKIATLRRDLRKLRDEEN